MALVAQAAAVAQFAGVDAYGLIKMIAEAAQTVRRNRATCLQLARRVKMIGDLLKQLHGAQLMQQPETRNPLEQLEETLRRAYLLVRSCQGRSYVYRCFMGGRHADELMEVQSEITFYLQLFPLVSYVDATLNWVRHLNQADPSCKEAPLVRPYFVPLVILSWDGSCLAVVEKVHLGLQSSRVRAAVADTVESVHKLYTSERQRVRRYLDARVIQVPELDLSIITMEVKAAAGAQVQLALACAAASKSRVKRIANRVLTRKKERKIKP